MYNLFYYSDIVSLPPHVYISKKTKNPTSFGFILSLITYIIILYVTINNFLKPSIIYLKSQELSNRTLNNSEFNFSIHKYGTEEFKNNISFQIFLSKSYNGERKIINYTQINDVFQIKDLVNINGNVHCYIQFYCINENCTIFQNQNNYIRFRITFKPYSFNHSNFEHPLNKITDTRGFYFFPERKKEIKASLININYITKGGINWNQKENKTFIDEDIYESSFISSNNTLLGQFRFEINLDQITYERIYPTIEDILSNIGGFITIMKTITYFIFILYSEINSNINIIENILKKENTKINNKILLSYKINDIKKNESIVNDRYYELNETKDNLVDKDINKNNDEEYKEFKKLFNIHFFAKICKCFTNNNKKKLMKFCNAFVSEYLSVENIILNQIYFEEYYTKIIKRNNELTNDELKYDEQKEIIQDT